MELLPFICAALVGLALFAYVVLSGLDLGIGLLSLIAPRLRDREAMLESLSPLWYGSAVWLALGYFLIARASPTGVAFLKAVWPWLAMMLLGLSLRGAAYALRGRLGVLLRGLGRIGDLVFGLASGLTILCQGLVLGAALSGVPDSGSVLGLALVLGMICTGGLVGIYALLGAGWLIWRSQGALQTFGREVGHAAVILTAASIALACAWPAFAGVPVSARWTFWQGGVILPALAATTLGLCSWIWRGLWNGRLRRTLDRAVGVVLAVFVGLAASLWPVVVPNAVSPGFTRNATAVNFTVVDVALLAPVLIVVVIHVARLLRASPAAETAGPSVSNSHAGRRAPSLRGNDLHLS